MSLSIHIKASGDKKFSVLVDPSSTIEDLKTIIAAESDIAPERQRLIYSGKVLKDHETVLFYKIQEGHTIHMVMGAAKPSPAPAASTPAAASTPSAPTTSGGDVPTNISTGTGLFNPLADLTGARYAGYTQLPLASMFGPDGGMGAFLSPEQMSSIMLSPGFQEQMNAMLLNPQMLDFLIQQNPQLRAMGPQARAMMQLPMFRQMMSNPELLRGMMGAQGAGATPAFPAPGANPTVGDASADAAAPADTAAPDAASNPFASLFPGGMPQLDPAMFGGAPAPAAEDTRPPEVRYETQLSQLNDMGFYDFDQNVAALRRSGGNVQGALEFLLSGGF